MTSAAYRPYEPLNTLEQIADDIWIADGPEIRFRVGLLRIPFPTRMTVVRLPGGRIWIHSPIEIAGALAEEVARLGPVTFLIAPNSIHYWWVADWKARFPGADVWACSKMAAAATDRLPQHQVLGPSAPAQWAGVIDQVLVPGSKITEVDFFHQASRTLIVTDLIENFEVERFTSPFYKFLSRVGGTRDPDGKAPLELRSTFRRYRAELVAAVDQMIAWQPERIIVAHGRWYRANALDELRRAFRWI